MNRALFVKNLSYNVTPEELFDLFGKYGPIRQVRQGIASNTKGTAFVVYEDVMDAKQACDKLNGYNFQNRYLVVLYHQPDKMLRTKEDLDARKENLERLKKQHDSLQSQRNSSGGPSSSTSTSSRTKAASALKAPRSVLKRGRPDIATHARRMPHFVRKLLPTVPECA
ncbi:Splicing factor 3B subunit 6-like protein [Madurella mycetomatis]|uniref:Splicing factor 3B subunit 6-like protein n=1 Tax=Madurella mycetomatis TaxID=100816 RepID=A0A175WAH8_9PEZI|nr:Splicing factor 3B subunit 6-like protein [Madurella mycetomatis]